MPDDASTEIVSEISTSLIFVSPDEEIREILFALISLPTRSPEDDCRLISLMLSISDADISPLVVRISIFSDVIISLIFIVPADVFAVR